MPGFCVFLLHGNRFGVASDPSAVGYRSSSVVTRLDHLGFVAIESPLSDQRATDADGERRLGTAHAASGPPGGLEPEAMCRDPAGPVFPRVEEIP